MVVEVLEQVELVGVDGDRIVDLLPYIWIAKIPVVLGYEGQIG